MKPAPSTSRANPLVETLGVAVWGALRFFAIALFVLLVVNSVAILTLNLVYETEALRHRYYWPGVLSRNAILGIFVFLLYLFANSRPSVGKASADRFSSLKVKALRVLSWLIFPLIAIIETVALAENLLFHQTATLVRTHSQTLNLIYSVLFGSIAVILLVRTNTGRPEPKILPAQLRSLATNLFWRGLKTGALFGFFFAIIFTLGALFVYKTAVEGQSPSLSFFALHFPVFAAVYVFAGLLCGGLAGGIYGIRSKAEEVVRGSYSLAEPLVKNLLSKVSIDELTNRDSLQQIWGRGKDLVGEQPSGILGRLMQMRFLRSVQKHWLFELVMQFKQQQAAGATRESLENLLSEKIVQVTADDIKARLELLQWLTYALAIVMLLSPALLFVMVVK